MSGLLDCTRTPFTLNLKFFIRGLKSMLIFRNTTWVLGMIYVSKLFAQGIGLKAAKGRGHRRG